MFRWRWWPFGEVKDIYNFVGSHIGREDLGEVEFIWEGDNVVVALQTDLSLEDPSKNV